MIAVDSASHHNEKQNLDDTYLQAESGDLSFEPLTADEAFMLS